MIPLLTTLACRTACSAPLPVPAPAEPGERVDPGGPVALFQRPFAEDHPVTNFFDHGAGQRGRSLMRDGRVTWGFEDHHAYDFVMPVGTELFAMADGEVLHAGDVGPKRCPDGSRAPSSVELRILHQAPDGRLFVADYRHLSAVDVTAGQRVAAGAIVARSGDTGCSSGPHLHLEIVRVLDRERREGKVVDPYGWAGPGPDPWASHGGAPSVWLWKEGQAPAITRGARGPDHPGAERVELGPHRMVGTDPVDPVGGEWVEIGVSPDAKRERSLAGWSIGDDAGERFALPAVTLRPGQTLRVWSNRAAPGPGEVSWGRTTEAWSDLGDCVTLRDPQQVVRATLSFGHRCG